MKNIGHGDDFLAVNVSEGLGLEVPRDEMSLLPSALRFSLANWILVGWTVRK